MNVVYRICLVLWVGQHVAYADLFEVDIVNGTDPDVPSTRIIGGQGASEGQFPHQVSLRDGGSHICGGSVISAQYILTAAHCVQSRSTVTPPSRLSVRAGSRQRTEGGTIVAVAEVKVHPNYRFPGNDVALLRLAQPLQFNDRVRAIPLASSNVPNGASVVASGWGYTRPGGSTPTLLQFVTLRAISELRCRRITRGSAILCLAHNQGQGVCSGDSGGPAVYNNALVGVASFTLGRCGTNSPDGFAKVSELRNWITDNSRE